MSNIQFEKTSLLKEAQRMKQACEVLRAYNASTLSAMAEQMVGNGSFFCKKMSDILTNLQDTKCGDLVAEAEKVADELLQIDGIATAQDQKMATAFEGTKG